MALNESDMYEQVRKYLRRRYQKNEGWEIYDQDSYSRIRIDFIVEKKYRNGRIERVICEVKAEIAVKRAHIDQINNYAKSVAGGNTSIKEKLLITPSGVNVTEDMNKILDKNNIKLIRLKSFVTD